MKMLNIQFISLYSDYFLVSCFRIWVSNNHNRLYSAVSAPSGMFPPTGDIGNIVKLRILMNQRYLQSSQGVTWKASNYFRNLTAILRASPT